MASVIREGHNLQPDLKLHYRNRFSISSDYAVLASGPFGLLNDTFGHRLPRLAPTERPVCLGQTMSQVQPRVLQCIGSARLFLKPRGPMYYFGGYFPES